MALGEVIKWLHPVTLGLARQLLEYNRSLEGSLNGYLDPPIPFRSAALALWILRGLRCAESRPRASASGRESDNAGFHGGPNPAGSWDCASRQKTDAQDLAQRRTGCRLPHVRCRQRTAPAGQSPARAAVRRR